MMGSKNFETFWRSFTDRKVDQKDQDSKGPILEPCGKPKVMSAKVWLYYRL